MKQLPRLLAATSLLLTLTACHAPAGGHAAQAAAPMELKIYEVPAAQTEKLAGALGNALGGNASITMPAPGKLLVYAPHDAQASIGHAIASLGEKATTAEATGQVDLHFWIVDGLAGTGDDDAALRPLAPSLDTVRKTMGRLHFQLVQAMSAMNLSINHDGGITTALTNGYPRTANFHIDSADGRTIDLSLNYEDRGESGLAKLRTQVDVPSGQYVVLAQAPGACAPALPGGTAPPCAEKPALRLLVLRADYVPAGP